MDTDDLEPPPKKKTAVDMEAMSIEALEDHIAGLEAEIVQARQMIGSKQAARTGAESFFKT